MIPLTEKTPLPLIRVCETAYMVERYAFDAASEQEETRILDEQKQGEYHRPLAFFNSQGQPVQEPFTYETKRNRYNYGDDTIEYDDWGESVPLPDSLLCNYQQVWKSGKVGLLDVRTSRMLLEPEFSYMQIMARMAYASHRMLDTTYTGRGNTLIDLQIGKEWRVPDTILIRVRPRTGDLILAENTRTKLIGFVSPAGRVVIPFHFIAAYPFPPTGRTQVQRTDSIWYEIDSKGRNTITLGKSPFQHKDRYGHVWIISDSDNLYRIRQAPADLPLGRMGLNNVPMEVTGYGKIKWVAHKGYKSGLLDKKGHILLPFEFDYIIFGFSGPLLPQDTPLLKKYFTVSKNDRRWLFDARTLQPLRPNLEPGNGLILGTTFEQSNFSLVQPVSGDSLFKIELNQDNTDLLNIRTGRRWNTRNARSLRLSYEWETGGPYLYLREGSGSEERFYLDGRRAPWITNGYNGYLKGFGNWRAGTDVYAGDAIVLDSAERLICRFPMPFAGTNRITVEVTREGLRMPFAVVVKSETGEMAVFSLKGHRISPPGITAIWMYRDMLFAAQKEKWGAFLLPEGREVLPFLYKQILLRDGKLSAIDFTGTETQFDLQGKLLRRYPEGYLGLSSFSDGLQLVTDMKERTFVNEQLEFVRFPGVIQAGPFSEGMADVQMADQRWKYIRPTGEQAFDGFYAHATPFLKSRAVVTTLDGSTQLIDTTGKVIMQSRRPGDCCNRAILRLGDDFFIVKDSLSNRIYNSAGRLILEDCTCSSTTMEQGFASFFCAGKFWRLWEDGHLEEMGKKDFVFEKDIDGGVRSWLPNFPCPVEGLLGSFSGEWIVEPRPYYRVSARTGAFPIVFIYHKDSSENQTVINRKTGKTLATGINPLSEVRGLGWLVQQTGTDSTFLYTPDFSTKRPWPAEYTQIQWNDYVQLYEVRKTDNTFVGYMSRKGHVLFKD